MKARDRAPRFSADDCHAVWLSGSQNVRSRATIQRSQTLLDRKDIFVELPYRAADIKPAARPFFKASSQLPPMLPESFERLPVFH